MLADRMVNRADHRHLLGEARRFAQRFGEAHSGDGGVDEVVIGASGAGLRAATLLGIERVDLRHAAAEPDKDAVFRASAWHRRGCGTGGAQRCRQRKRGRGSGSVGKERTTIHVGRSRKAWGGYIMW